MSDLNKALHWGRLLHLAQKQRQGFISVQELAEMRQLRGQQRTIYGRFRRMIKPLMGDWTRL